ncbi:endo-1,4-beta-xylanase [Balneolales bacterium ANBcel1]|nr:endo-1,4-beta-xylanase [Balneolales bacterium ANBcel1]
MKSILKKRALFGVFVSAFLFLFATGSVLAEENGNGNGDPNGETGPVPVNVNGSFEDAELGPVEDLTGIPGWVLELGGDADADFEIVDYDAQDGEKSLRTTVNAVGANAWNIQVIGDGIPVEPGASYLMSVWMKAENDGPVDVTIGNYDFNEYGRSSQNLVAGEWTLYELDFTVTDQETEIRAPLHFSFGDNVGNVIYVDNLQIVLTQEAPARRMPVVVDLAEGQVGSFFEVSTEEDGDDSFEYITITQDGWDIADPADPDWSDIWASPISEDHIVTLEVTFPYAGEYKLYMRGRVGPGAADDDSFFYPDSLRGEMAAEDTTWLFANQIDVAGYSEPGEWVTDGGAAGVGIWKWLNISDGNYHNDGVTYHVDSDDTTIVFQIGGRETDFDMHRIAFGRADLFYTVNMLNNVQPGVSEIPDDPIEIHPGPPLADGLDKFLGNIWEPPQLENFENYWNQVAPENAGKWGSVERTRGEYNWTNLDAAYNLAKDNGWPFRFHVLVWGSQQPAWIDDLSEEEQLQAVEDWFRAVAERYPDIDHLEVVNEPGFANPPYMDALGGSGETGWDWIITAFEMARDIFPSHTKLMINHFGILSGGSNLHQHLNIIELLQERDLIDAIGVQGHHFTMQNITRSTLTSSLNQLAATGLPITVTEYDAAGRPTGDENVNDPDFPQDESDANQLEVYQRTFPVIWEHPGVEGVTLWGWRLGGWRPGRQMNLVRANGEERPALKWLIEYMDEYRHMPTDADLYADEQPTQFRLHGNYPNPFNPTTQIRYEISDQANVSLKVYDITGRLVQTLVSNTTQTPGQYSVTFDGSNLASGVYLYRLQAGSFSDVQRMMLVK